MRTAKQIYDEHLSILSQLTGLEVESIRNSRANFAPLYRGFVIEYLRDKGFTLQQISEAVERNHATVLHSLAKSIQYESAYIKDIYTQYHEIVRSNEIH